MPEYFRIMQEQETFVLELYIPAGIDASEFDRLNQRALAELEDKVGSDAWVLDSSMCRYVGSAALGFLVNIRQKINASGGTLILCNVAPSIASILRVSSLGRLFAMADTRETAITQANQWRAKSRRK
jgi:anti-sigma B factor antagonist